MGILTLDKIILVTNGHLEGKREGVFHNSKEGGETEVEVGGEEGGEGMKEVVEGEGKEGGEEEEGEGGLVVRVGVRTGIPNPRIWAIHQPLMLKSQFL